MSKRKSQEKSDHEHPLETSPSLKSHPTRKELYAIGKRLRDKTPRESHAEWHSSHNRPDPIELMEKSNQGRIEHLIPVRHGRMLRSEEHTSELQSH